MMTTTKAEASGRIRVILVEDHPMFRERLAELINVEPDMEVCGQAETVHEAMELVRRAKPDLAIVDITLKDGSGLELIKDLKAQSIQLPVLVLSMHQESLYAERILQAGAKGYVSKNQAASEVMKAIRQILAGDVYLSPEVTAGLLKRIAASGGSSETVGMNSLTDRELEIFQLIGRGKGIPEIGRLMNLGNSTVETYRARIRTKLGIKNAAGLYSVAATWVRDNG